MRLLAGLLFPATILALAWWMVGGVSAGEETATISPERTTHLVALDSSGRGNHGVNQGLPSLGLPGRQGTSYSFNANGSWTQVASKPSVNPGPRDFAMSAWVNFVVPPETGETYDIIRKGLSYTPGGEFKLEVIPGGYLRCTVKDSTGLDGSVSGREHSIADGKWHKVGCARRGSTWSAIVDGVVFSNPVDLGSVTNTLPLSIGSKYGQEDGNPGRVDEVRFYVTDRKATTKKQQLRLTGLWHLDEAQRINPGG